MEREPTLTHVDTTVVAGLVTQQINHIFQEGKST